MKKRIFCILFAALLAVMPVLAAPSAAAVTASSASAKPGETVTVTVSMADNPGLASWLMDVSWDGDALQLEGIGQGSAFSSGIFLSNPGESSAKVTWCAATDSSSSGEMFTLTFKVKDGASGNYPVTVTCSEQNTVNVKEQKVPVKTVSGSVSVTGSTSGGGNTSGSGENPEKTPGGETKPPKDNTVSFTDIKKSDFFYESVLWAAEKGITSGVAKNRFDPNGGCTRAQVVTFIWRAMGSPSASGRTGFTDVPTGAYYAEAVRWAVKNGVTNGTSANRFSPDAPVTRAQVVTFLWRAKGEQRAKSAASFTDLKKNAYYLDAVSWAVEKKITTGTSRTAFSPESVCTRGQIVTFLYRCFK